MDQLFWKKLSILEPFNKNKISCEYMHSSFVQAVDVNLLHYDVMVENLLVCRLEYVESMSKLPSVNGTWKLVYSPEMLHLSYSLVCTWHGLLQIRETGSFLLHIFFTCTMYVCMWFIYSYIYGSYIFLTLSYFSSLFTSALHFSGLYGAFFCKFIFCLERSSCIYRYLLGW